MREKDKWFTEIALPIRRAWRHRPGLKIFGKEVIKDNQIPGLILDTIDNLNLVTRDKRRPEIVSKRKTDRGWYIILGLPPGLAPSQFIKRQEWFSSAVKGFVDIQSVHGLLHLDISINELSSKILFSWDPQPYVDRMALPWPIGFSHGNKLLVVDLSKFPHCLSGGATNFGKSSFILVLVYSLLFLQQICPNRVRVAMADLKGLDFYQLAGHALVFEDEPSILKFLKWLAQEHEKRKAILRSLGLKKIQQYPGDDIPYIVFIIDEFAEIQNKNIHAEINRAVRLYRATGIHLVTATQRPSIVGGVMDGDTRAQFPARVCFKVSSEGDSRMILGEQHNEAAWLPGDIPGRALFNFGVETKLIQSMFITEDLEHELLSRLDQKIGRWDFESGTTRLLPR
jgi:S-DNA-T family DNA segregation ATPase FtsK/SpoIIIE